MLKEFLAKHAIMVVVAYVHCFKLAQQKYPFVQLCQFYVRLLHLASTPANMLHPVSVITCLRSYTVTVFLLVVVDLQQSHSAVSDECRCEQFQIQDWE